MTDDRIISFGQPYREEYTYEAWIYLPGVGRIKGTRSASDPLNDILRRGGLVP